MKNVCLFVYLDRYLACDQTSVANSTLAYISLLSTIAIGVRAGDMGLSYFRLIDRVFFLEW